MSIEIKKIYLENYKLFTIKEIDFSNYLCVFDGPNGYGKTSIFDAIELLITGSISRIQESEVVAANISYSKNCLANDPEKDIRIKAEFKDNLTDKSIVIALCIPASVGAGKQNNPKSIETQTQSYILPTYDTPTEFWKDNIVSPEIISSKRKEFFGTQNINLFKMLHYIHQEDRLAYFKKSESERGKTITELFGIEEDVEKLAKVNDAQRQLSNKLNKLREQIQGVDKEIKSLPQASSEHFVYESLSNGDAFWDKENLGFKGSQTKAVFEQMKRTIRDISAFIENKHWYCITSSIYQFEKIQHSKRQAAIQGWLLKKTSETFLEETRKTKEVFDFLTEQAELVSNNTFNNVDWKKMCAILNCDDSLETIVGYVKDLNCVQQNQTNLGKLAEALYQARETLALRKGKFDSLKDGTCPYCGYQWSSDSLLQEQFANTKSILESILGSENTMLSQTIQKCKVYYDNVFKEKLEVFITSINNNAGFQLLNKFNDYKDFYNSIENCDKILRYLESSECTIRVDFSEVYSIESAITEIKNTIPTSYESLSMEHGFDKVFKEYFSNKTYMDSITVEKLKAKERYIEEQYYSSFDQVRQKLDIMKQQEEKLSSLVEEMKAYHKALKKAIELYQQLVIKQIEIPFFLYCSRLLQSYQGGQGVLIDSKDSKIRFTAPGGEHDILYTMSSGQLSAVLLAFSLVLNKIYSGEKFKTLFIDDPIQCMDDINMISFVELLRREFSETQIILSTHEDTFANYIKYKFSKYNIRSQSITLKNDM